MNLYFWNSETLAGKSGYCGQIVVMAETIEIAKAKVLAQLPEDFQDSDNAFGYLNDAAGYLKCVKSITADLEYEEAMVATGDVFFIANAFTDLVSG